MGSRRWLVVVATVALVAVFISVNWRSSRDVQQPGSARSTYSLGECHSYPEPVGAAGYNAIAQGERDPMIVGGDVAASTAIGDGRHVWMFGDTSRNIGGTIAPVTRNTMLLVGNGCRAVVIAPGGGAAIPDRADGVGYWPMSMVSYHANGVTTLIVSAERVQGREEELSFVNLGPAIATFTIPDGAVPSLSGVVDLGPDSSSRRTVAWGAALAADGSGLDDALVYVYGTSNPERSLVFGFSVRVARVRIADITDRSQWSYWTGSTWSSDSDDSAEVIGAVGGVSQTFSVFTHDGRWYAMSKRDGYLGTGLALWPAPHPWGPFGAPVTVGSIANSPDNSTVLRYMPLAHPELNSGSSNTVIVSVSRNSLNSELLRRFPFLYRPFFVDIELPPKPSIRSFDRAPTS